MSNPSAPLKKITMRIFEGDDEILQRFFPKVGYQVAARQIIHKAVRNLLEREAQLVEESTDD